MYVDEGSRSGTEDRDSQLDQRRNRRTDRHQRTVREDPQRRSYTVQVRPQTLFDFN